MLSLTEAFHSTTIDMARNLCYRHSMLSNATENADMTFNFSLAVTV